MKEEIIKLFKHIENRQPSNKHFYMIWFNSELDYELYCDLHSQECYLNPKKKPFLKESFHISKAAQKIFDNNLCLQTLMPELEKHVFAPILYKELLERELREIMPNYEQRYDSFSSFYKSLPKMISETISESKRNNLKVIKDKDDE